LSAVWMEMHLGSLQTHCLVAVNTQTKQTNWHIVIYIIIITQSEG